MEDYFYREHKCSECGQSFSFESQGSYKYKTNNSGHIEYQCGYTCYNHALLRSEGPDSYYPEDKYGRYVDKCERAMKGQGKEILHPIRH